MDMRIDADLVVLSACDTGLGKELGAEGLIGLTRAFQYAGARSTIASLWSVEDVHTAELMVSFYNNLRAGAAKDEALQAAQIGFIKKAINGGPDAYVADPYYWAAFQLSGDWK
jgi:CHAT domain-containing protein